MAKVNQTPRESRTATYQPQPTDQPRARDDDDEVMPFVDVIPTTTRILPSASIRKQTTAKKKKIRQWGGEDLEVIGGC